MRPTQRQRYAEQIDRLVRYLHALDWSDGAAGVDDEKLAAAANLSPWHFDRVGSPSQVTQAAMESGYASSQAFARAVRRVTGLSPTDLARSKGA